MNLKCLLLGLLCILFACNQNKLEGTFVYTEVPKEKIKTKDMFEYSLQYGVEMGKEIACSSIGIVTFKNGKCYYSVNFLGVEQAMKVDYHIDNGVIYINSNLFNQGGVGLFELVDNNTITYQGCIFKRVDLNKLKEGKTISKVNLRAGPGTNYEILKSLEKDSELFLIENNGEWMKVRAVWNEGFVQKKFIKFD